MSEVITQDPAEKKSKAGRKPFESAEVALDSRIESLVKFAVDSGFSESTVTTKVSRAYRSRAKEAAAVEVANRAKAALDAGVDPAMLDTILAQLSALLPSK
jgi:hypothetical protein